MTEPSGYAKTLALPAGFDAPRLLRYDDVPGASSGNRLGCAAPEVQMLKRGRSAEPPQMANASLNVAPERSGWSLPVEAEPGDVVEDGIRSEERRADVDGGSCDPLVSVDWFVERMSDLSAGVTYFRCGRQESVADRDDGGRCDRLLEPLATLLSPAGDEGPIAKFDDGGCC